jgi:dTDP-4-amino-4,6-dideoxygalactose transaminase
VIEHPERDALKAHLETKGIQTVINYPRALPFLPAYERFGARPEDFPNAFAMQSRILSLPMFAEMSETQIDAVSDAVREFAGAGA